MVLFQFSLFKIVNAESLQSSFFTNLLMVLLIQNSWRYRLQLPNNFPWSLSKNIPKKLLIEFFSRVFESRITVTENMSSNSPSTETPSVSVAGQLDVNLLFLFSNLMRMKRHRFTESKFSNDSFSDMLFLVVVYWNNNSHTDDNWMMACVFFPSFGDWILQFSE